MLCPNLIVRDRLEEDFENGKVFADRDLIPEGAIVTKDDFALSTLGSDRPGGWANMLGATVILGNIHQFYASNASGLTNLSSLMNGPSFALFNDEAHNSPAPQWDATLEKMRPKTILRVDTTATPDRADGQRPRQQHDLRVPDCRRPRRQARQDAGGLSAQHRDGGVDLHGRPNRRDQGRGRDRLGRGR